MLKAAAIEHFGTATKLAEALGIGKALVSKWPDVVPARYQYEIERLTGGALEAQWPPSDRPEMVIEEPKTRRRERRAAAN